ncbi:MAG: xanthine dehydrogenase family protein molybdopterin-binding subunit, partial [Bacteroidetes bacterium]
MGKWTRRAFITTGVLAGGAVVLGVAIRPGKRAPKVAGMVSKPEETLLNIWVKIDPDNVITAIVPHAEMGQGTHTTLAMMLADEMDADWDKVRMMEAPAHKEYANYALIKGFLAGETEIPAFLVDTADGVFLTIGKRMNIQITGGSTAVALTGMSGMRVAGAAAKAMLLQAAAQSWGVPVEELTAKKSIIYHAISGRSGTFASFAQQAATFSSPAKPRLKSPKDFTIMGTSPGRLDIPAKVTGEALFGIDVRLPNMKYAAIKAAPVFGSKLKAADEEAALKLKGVHKVVKLEEAVAVVADSYWLARRALGSMKVEFTQTQAAGVSSETIFERFEQALDAAADKGESKKDVKKGNAQKILQSAQQLIKAEYRVPYLAHATMEPMNATAWIHEGQCELWTGSQNPLGLVNTLARVLEMSSEQVKVYNQYLGGGFGRRGESDVAVQATRIAREAGVPVQLIWSREEDIQHDFYREANMSRFQAALDESGFPLAWMQLYVDKHHPGEAPHLPYSIANQYIHYAPVKTHVPWGNWRSVDHSIHGFFTESFIDELAHAAGQDPYEYRRALLKEAPRFRAVLELAAEKAGWGTPLPPGQGRGIALHKSFGSLVAEVAEVEVQADQLKVKRVVCAVDPGFAMHPDGLTAQMESGIVYGLTAALYGEIRIEG